MTLRQYLVLMALGTLLAWGAVTLVVMTVDPTLAQPGIFVAFYASAYLALAGTFSIVGLLLRIGMLRRQPVVSRHVAVSFRQALLLAALVCGGLFLHSRQALSWWSALLMAFALTVAEAVLISAKAKAGMPRQP